MDDSQNLLLLPPIPEPATYPAIKAAFHAPLQLALRMLQESVLGRSILDIALSFPYLWNQKQLPRSVLYNVTEEAVANVYKLICVIAAQQGIEVADVEGDSIDVRLILLAYPRDGNLKGRSLTGSILGPVVELHVLARCERPWAKVFSIETEQGEVLLKNFMSFSENNPYRYEKLRGGVVQVSRATGSSLNSKTRQCHSVAVGGTFDHLHIGHKLLLTMTAFALDPPDSDDNDKVHTKVVTIGMTAADLLAKKKYAELLQSWKTRTERTHAFIRGIINFSPKEIEKSEEVHKAGPNGHAVITRIPWMSAILELRYVEIWDPFGPTITDPAIDTIVVSGETRSGGKMVNDKRNEVGMKELKVFEVDVLDTEEEEGNNGSRSSALENAFLAKLSSSEIRKAQAEKLKGRSKV
jgi:phosphopantetheine adenylyltransferase